jgi:antirestriction protein ArdC
MDRKQLYADVTAQVVRQIEQGAGEWQMPWRSLAIAGVPVNATTGNAYKGGNNVWLGMTAAGRDWSRYWATYKQWQSVGAQVRKGERGSYGVHYGTVGGTVTDDDGNELVSTAKRLVPHVFVVFNADQVDGWQAPARRAIDTPERIDHAETFFASLGADVRHGGSRAYYAAVGDFIGLPPLEAFRDAVSYYATSAHEHAHWTGHASRLGRDLHNRFGEDAYAAEELVAELSSAFTCAHLGISTTPRPDHAAYLASWLRVLRADPSALFTAATKAQAATDWLVAHATEAPMGVAA